MAMKDGRERNKGYGEQKSRVDVKLNVDYLGDKPLYQQNDAYSTMPGTPPYKPTREVKSNYLDGNPNDNG